MSKENIYEITKNNSITYTPQWAIGIDYKNEFVEFAWCEVTFDKRPGFFDHTLRVLVNNENARHSYDNLFRIIQQIRMDEVFEEIIGSEILNAPQKVDSMNPADVADLVEKIYHKVETGEFLGQRYRFIYVDEVAKILQCSPSTVFNAIENILIPERKIGLNGFILVSFETYDENKKTDKIITGHKDINISDFGYWYCKSCDKSGDEYDNPADVVCE